MRVEENMKTITLAMQKGGTGKSVIADQLGYSLKDRGYKVQVLDLDPQQSSVFQNYLAENEEPDFQIVDTRGALDLGIKMEGSEVSIEDIIEASDLVIIPVLPENESIDPLSKIARLCESQNANWKIVVNQYDRRHIVDSIIFDDLKASYTDHVLETTLSRSEALKKARLAKVAVKEIDPKARYASEFERLTDEILEAVNGK
jgi:chromosome partitioning protein